MVFTLLAILVAFILGFSVVVIFWPASFHRSALPLTIFLGIGLGLGLSSCLFFLWISIFHGRHTGFARAETVFVILLAACALFLRCRTRQSASELQNPQPEASPMRWLACIQTASFLIALLVAAIGFTRLSLASPHGSFDAWGIWNLHAKFLFLNDQHWQDGFSQNLAWSHPDYPLLVSASIARCWSYAAAENTLAPVCIAALFSIGTIGLLVSALSLLRSLSQGLLAGTILLSTPFLIILSAAQYADVPLAFFLLATIVLFSLSRRTKRILVLAGIAAGLAAWTKNEGILFLASLLLAYVIQGLRTRHWKQHSRELGAVIAGLLPILALLIYFKSSTATYNDLFSQPGTLLHRLIDLSRYRTIFKALLSEVFTFGAWFVSIIPCVAFYVLLVGLRRNARITGNAICYVTLGLTVAGYFMIYLIAPFSLDWLLSSSLNRLLIQLWPSILFLIFIHARNPAEALQAFSSSDSGNKRS